MTAEKIAPPGIELGHPPPAMATVHNAGAEEIGARSAIVAWGMGDRDRFLDALPVVAAKPIIEIEV